MKQTLLILAAVVFLFACKKEEDPTLFGYSSEIDVGFFNSSYLMLADGNILISTATTNKLTLLKITPTCIKVWTKQFFIDGTPNGLRLSSMLEDNGGWLYLFGTVPSNSTSDAFLFKLNSKGDSLWWNNYPNSQFNSGKVIVKSTDGNLVLAGMRANYYTNKGEFCLAKADTMGTVLWHKIYERDCLPELIDMISTSDGGYLLTGISQIPGLGFEGQYCVKVNSDGQKMWDKIYPASYVSHLKTLEASNGDIITTGRFRENGTDQIWLLKTDMNGNEKWKKTFGKAFNDEFVYSIIENDNGNLLVVGGVSSFNTDTVQAMTFVASPDGDSIRTKYFGAKDNAFALKVFKLNNTTNLLFGRMFTNGVTKIFTNHIDANGNFIP